MREAVEGIVALLEREPRDLREVPLDLRGVDEFAAGVYAAARLVGPGELCTYGDLARAVGSPGGAQAVGRATGFEPVPDRRAVPPCALIDGRAARLLGARRIATKRRMLEIERAPGFTQQTLFA